MEAEVILKRFESPDEVTKFHKGWLCQTPVGV
jgi:hypothetical protein